MSTPRRRPPVHHRLPEQLIAALVPTPAERHAEPLRLPAVPPPRQPRFVGTELVVGMARLDRTGRVREHAVFDALGWHPGQRLTLTTSDEVIVFVADPRGGHRVDQRGAITVPAAARQLCGIERGPAVVLTAVTSDQALLVHSAALLMPLLTEVYHDILGGLR